MSISTCVSCGARNRVPAAATGLPRCAKCKADLPWVVDADTATFAEETRASVPVVVDFWAAWCAPCRMIAPVLQDLAERHAGRLKVVKVDVDANPQISAAFQVQSIPSVVAIIKGQPVPLFQGAYPEAQVRTILDELLRVAGENGVTGTPTVLIDGEPAGETPQESVDAVLEAVS